MNRLFGTKSLVPRPTLNDAVKNTEERISQLDVKITKLNSELLGYQLKLSKMRDGPGKSALKQKAIKVLKQKKQIELQKDQLDSQAWNMSQAQMTTDNLKNTMVTVDAMKQANKELKKTYGKIDIDKIEDLQDEMLDLVERSNELQSSLLANYDVPDDISEGELDAELEALGEEFDNEIDADEVPSYLKANSGEIPSFIDEEEASAPLEEDKVAL